MTLTETLRHLTATATELEAMNHAALTGEEPEPALTEARPHLAALLQEADGLAADLVARLAVLRRRFVPEGTSFPWDVHWWLGPESRAAVCGTPGATERAASVEMVTCPACKAALETALPSIDRIREANASRSMSKRLNVMRGRPMMEGIDTGDPRT